jgi:hypothetical protein
MLNKSISKDIVALCKSFDEGMKSGQITKSNYSINFKVPYLQPFEKKYDKSPNLVLQDELKEFYRPCLKGKNDKILYRNFGFWGNNIYSYVWTCVYFDFGHDSLPASYSPQLYILANKMGIKFGFCYGHQISDNDKMVHIVKREVGKAQVFDLLKKDSELCFFNSSTQDITARPEVLFGKEERIIVNKASDIPYNWSSRSLLIKEYSIEEIPDNISEVIQKTLCSLVDFYLSLLPIKTNTILDSTIPNKEFTPNSFYQGINNSNIFLSKKIIYRFLASILTKPFVIFTGLSGSGKTKLAQSFVKWISESEDQYRIVPVGADWTNREPLLGFPNGLDEEKYVSPDSGALKLITTALKSENKAKPYFLILDEMNLSHVERYFADFLSVMESKDSIKLYSGEIRECSGEQIDKEVTWPENLFIIGTVNIDETTYMFSPKVLDRANVIEFRITENEIEKYLASEQKVNMKRLFVGDDTSKTGLGSNMGSDFLNLAKSEVKPTISTSIELVRFFTELKKTGAEFGYRSASEINRLIAILETLTVNEEKWDDETTIDRQNDFIDIAIMQKLLPKLHGSRNKLTKILPVLGGFCLEENEKIKENYFEKFDSIEFGTDSNIKYKISFEKICRMYKNAVENGYASYAEA